MPNETNDSNRGYTEESFDEVNDITSNQESSERGAISY